MNLQQTSTTAAGYPVYSYVDSQPQNSGAESVFNNSDVIDRINSIQRLSRENSALSEAYAENQRNWSERMWQKNSEFNAAEAAKNRNWQAMMSNTAHQREVNDLLAAGLNPVLSVSGGNGAATGSGATASSTVPSSSKGDVDVSANSAIINLLGSFLQAQTNLQMADVSARTQEAVADKYTSMSQLVAEINGATSRYVSDNSLKGSYAVSGATRYAADRSLEASKYATDSSRQSTLDSLEAAMQRQVQQQDWNLNNPSSIVGLLTSFLNGLGSVDGVTVYSMWSDLYDKVVSLVSNISRTDWNQFFYKFSNGSGAPALFGR